MAGGADNPDIETPDIETPVSSTTDIIDMVCPIGVTEDRCSCLIREIEAGTFPFPALDMSSATPPTLKTTIGFESSSEWHGTASYLNTLSEKTAQTMGQDTGIMTEYMICKMTDKLHSDQIYNNVSDLSAGIMGTSTTGSDTTVGMAVQDVKKDGKYIILLFAGLLIYLAAHSMGSMAGSGVGVVIGIIVTAISVFMLGSGSIIKSLDIMD